MWLFKSKPKQTKAEQMLEYAGEMKSRLTEAAYQLILRRIEERARAGQTSFRITENFFDEIWYGDDCIQHPNIVHLLMIKMLEDDGFKVTQTDSMPRIISWSATRLSKTQVDS